MKTPSLAIVASLAFAAACGGSSGGGASTPATASATTTAVFVFGEVSFFAGTGTDKPGPVLHADGTVTIKGDVLCTMASDGTLHTRDGKLLAQLGADGTLATPDGQVVGTLSPEGALTMTRPAQGSTPAASATLAFDAAGILVGGPPGGPLVRAQGLTPATRRAAMVTLVLFLLSSRGAATATQL